MMSGVIAEHERRIRDAEKERDMATGLRKKDLDRHVKRLKRELAECRMHLRRASKEGARDYEQTAQGDRPETV